MVGVDCVGGLQSDLLLRRWRRHGEVGARRLNDIHGVCELSISRLRKLCAFALWEWVPREVGRNDWGLYMGAVRLRWIINHGNAGSTRSFKCG